MADPGLPHQIVLRFLSGKVMLSCNCLRLPSRGGPAGYQPIAVTAEGNPAAAAVWLDYHRTHVTRGHTVPPIILNTPGGMRILDIEYVNPGDDDMLLEGLDAAAQAALAKTLVQLRQRETIWAAQATEQQRAIGWGDYAVYRWTGTTDPVFRAPLAGLTEPVTIYVDIPTREQFRANERRTGAGEAEVGRSLAAMDKAFSRGWRDARCYSAVDPDGDLGQVHVAVLTKITGEQFRAARAAGWPDVPLLLTPAQRMETETS